LIHHTADGNAVYYRVHGAGRELLIVHCAAGDADVYPELVKTLSSHFRCVTFDRPGYHRSEQLDRDTTVAEQVMAIWTVQQQVPADRVWVFAHSGGGNYALAYALAHPERVKGLILVEPALYAIFPVQERPPEIDRMQRVVLPLFQQGKITQGRAEFFAMFGWSTDEPASENWGFFGHELAVITRWCPSEADLHQVTLPVLILAGEKSPPLLQNISRRLAAHLGNARLILLEKIGHQSLWTEPQLIAAKITAFIDETEARAQKA